MLQRVRNWPDNKAATPLDWHWPHALDWRIMNLQSHACVWISGSECHFIMVCSCLRFWLQHSSGASDATDHSQDEEKAPFQRRFWFHCKIYFPARSPIRGCARRKNRTTVLQCVNAVLCLYVEIHQLCVLVGINLMQKLLKWVQQAILNKFSI